MSRKKRATSTPKAKSENVEVKKLQLDITSLKGVIQTLERRLDEMEAIAYGPMV